MKNALRRVYNAVFTVLICCVVLLAILLAGSRMIGLTPYTVLSGSMEPAYPVGSLLYVKKVDPNELRVRDPVTYKLPDGAIVTHRIIEVLEDTPEGRCFRTQGDANNTPDGILQPERVIGKPVFMIPYLGFVSWYVQRPPGSFIAIGGCMLLIILSMLPDMLPRKREEEAPAEASAEEPNEEPENPADESSLKT